MKFNHLAINGFGRIGRTLFRLLRQHPIIKVVAINDIADAATLSHLLNTIAFMDPGQEALPIQETT